MQRLPLLVRTVGSALLLGAFFVVSGSARPTNTADTPDVVTVESGKLQGTANADHSVRMFKGIPFAAPPVGDLRWKAPQPAKAWSGVRQADRFGSACLQTNVFGDIYFR